MSDAADVDPWDYYRILIQGPLCKRMWDHCAGGDRFVRMAITRETSTRFVQIAGTYWICSRALIQPMGGCPCCCGLEPPNEAAQ